MGLGKQSSDYWCGWCLLYWSSISYNGHGITVTVITFYLLSFVFFLKAPRSTGESCKILDAHADRTQRKRGCPSSLGMRHTEVLTPPRTHAHTPWRTPQHPREHCSQCEPSVELRSNAGGRRPSGQPYQRACSALALLSFVVANFSQHISFPILGVAKFWGQFKHANLLLLSILLGATDTVTGPFVSD